MHVHTYYRPNQYFNRVAGSSYVLALFPHPQILPRLELPSRIRESGLDAGTNGS